MANINLNYSNTNTSLTVTGLSTLASANYATSDAFNCTTNKPLDVLVRVKVTVGTVSGNKRIIVYAIGSTDNSTYQTQNSSAADTTHDMNMNWVGVIPSPSNSEAVERTFSIATAFDGVLPPYFKVVIRNDTGAAFTAGTVTTTEVIGTV